MADYPIAFDPALQIDPQAFATAWNQDAEARRAGAIHLTPTAAKDYHDPGWMLAVTTGIGIASGVLTSLISHILLHRYGLKRTFEVHTVAQQDGTHVIVVQER